MFTKPDLNNFRAEVTSNVTGESVKAAIAKDAGLINLTYHRQDGSYRFSLDHSIMKQGADFVLMVTSYVAMETGPYAPENNSLSKWVVSKKGGEGSFFYKRQLIRWYIDEFSPGQLSLYVKIDRRKSWMQRIGYVFTSKKRRKIHSDWRKNFA